MSFSTGSSGIIGRNHRKRRFTRALLVWAAESVPGKSLGFPGRSVSQNLRIRLERVMENVKKAGGTVEELEGSRSPFPLGEAEYYVLGPALHVTDSVNDEDPRVRRSRIHEQCAVLKFGKFNNWIMIPGDADRAAFEKHINNYHTDRMPAYGLAASHDG